MAVISSYIVKFRKMSPVAKASIALMVVTFLQKGLSMISGPIFTRIMPIEQYGIVSTFLSWQSVLYILFTLNMSAGVFNNGMIEYKDDRNGFSYSIMGLAQCITLIWLVIYIVFYKWLQPIIEMSNILVVVLYIYCLFVPAYNYWVGKERFVFRYKAPCLIMVLVSVISLVLSIIAVLLVPAQLKAEAKVIAAELPLIVLGICFSFYSFLSNRRKKMTKYWKYAFFFNVPLLVHYLSMYVLASSDRIMITKLVGSNYTAIYNVAYTVASIMLIFEQSIDASYAPWVYQKLDAEEYGSIRKRGQHILYLFCGATFLCALFAPEIIRVLAPKTYSKGVYVVPAVAASVYFTVVYSLFMRIELYKKKTSVITIATVIAALINIVLNYVLIPVFGFVAAGYTTLISYVFLAIFHGINLCRIGAKEIYNLKSILMLSFGVIAATVLITFFYDFTLFRYGMIALLLIVGFRNRKMILSLIRKA